MIMKLSKVTWGGGRGGSRDTGGRGGEGTVKWQSSAPYVASAPSGMHRRVIDPSEGSP